MPVPFPVKRPRPFTRAQAGQNRRFLAALAETGNARLAARRLGVHRATYTKRRAKSVAFAQDWDAALAAAHARFHRAGGERPPEKEFRAETQRRREVGEAASPKASGHYRAQRRAKLANQRQPRQGRSDPTTRAGPSASLRLRANPNLRTTGGEPTPLRTQGGEPMVIRLKSGRLQLRLAPAGQMTRAGEQAFLGALSASANVRLSAAAAGFAHSTLLARKRRSPAFAAGMNEAALAAPAAIERFLRETAEAAAAAHARHVAALPLWPEGMTIAQVLHQLGAPPFKLPTTPFPAKRVPSPRGLS